jgi:arylsulfatase A-like enzyme
MVRRNVFSALFFLFLGLRLFVLFFPGTAKEILIYKRMKGPEYHVILISVDTLRADHLHCYGYERATSPNIDRIAEEAVLFENAISQSAWTLPAHASMMTGKLASELGLIFYDEQGLDNKSVVGEMDGRLLTIAKALRRYGYETVSYNGGAWVAGEFGLDSGFDSYRWGGRYFKDNIARSIEWLKTRKQKRFFLFLHAYDVHAPYNAPEKFNMFYEYTGKYNKDEIAPDKTPAPLGSPEHLHIISQYDAGIRRADHEIGIFIDYLREQDLLDRSILIITSDHGEALQVHHEMWGHIYPLYEELIRVPLIIRAPGLKAARITEQVPACTSLLPTILDMLQIHERDADYGQSLTASFRGVKPEFEYIISETGRLRNRKLCRSVRTSEWKMSYYQADNREDRYELFDLVSDRTEARNIADENPELVDFLREKIPLFVQKNKKKRSRRALDEKTIEQLKSLGYIKK